MWLDQCGGAKKAAATDATEKRRLLLRSMISLTKAENRRDPFEPVNLIKAKRSRESKLIKDKKGVAQDAGYELEELKLVGILRTDKRRLAMMEDMQGRGIIFKKDDYLNKNLWVVDVEDTRVIFGY